MIYNKELTLNSLLVTLQNGNRDWGKIVHSFHNRNELRLILIRPFIGVFNTIQATLVISTMRSSTLSLTSTLKSGPDFIP